MTLKDRGCHVVDETNPLDMRGHNHVRSLIKGPSRGLKGLRIHHVEVFQGDARCVIKGLATPMTTGRNFDATSFNIFTGLMVLGVAVSRSMRDARGAHSSL